jgi:hypothetical protein
MKRNLANMPKVQQDIQALEEEMRKPDPVPVRSSILHLGDRLPEMTDHCRHSHGNNSNKLVDRDTNAASCGAK